MSGELDLYPLIQFRKSIAASAVERLKKVRIDQIFFLSRSFVLLLYASVNGYVNVDLWVFSHNIKMKMTPRVHDTQSA